MDQAQWSDCSALPFAGAFAVLSQVLVGKCFVNRRGTRRRPIAINLEKCIQVSLSASAERWRIPTTVRAFSRR